MANEIRKSFRLSATKGNLNFSKSLSDTFDMAGDFGEFGRMQNIGTTYEVIAISADVGTEGEAYFFNHDATNYVEIGLEVSAAFYPFCKLKPGRFAPFPLTPGVTYYARANTAACDLEFGILED